MAWDEWERLKSEAAERQSTGMRLNGDPDAGAATGAAPTGDLKVDQRDLAAVGNQAYELWQALQRDGNHARATSDTAARRLAAEAYALGGALSHVVARWEEQVQTLLDACAHVSNHLDYTQKAHAGDEIHIYQVMSGISQLDKGFDPGSAGTSGSAPGTDPGVGEKGGR